MTEEELDRLADKIVERKGGFWVDPEAHYQSHARLDKLLNMWDAAQGIFLKTLLALFILGVFAMVAVGLKFKGG